jgi:hypothetical protein
VGKGVQEHRVMAGDVDWGKCELICFETLGIINSTGKIIPIIASPTEAPTLYSRLPFP